MTTKSDKSDTKSTFQAQERTTLMKAKFIETLEMDRVAGNVLVAANAVGLSRDTVYRWRREDHIFAEKWSQAVILSGDKRADLAEDKLDEAVRKGNMTAIMYTLKKYRPEIFGNNRTKNHQQQEYLHTPSPRFREAMNRLYNRS